MTQGTEVITVLLVAFTSALVGGEIAQRLKMPSVVGQICAGVAVGPSALGWLTLNEPLSLLSELGAILLLFAVGLETKLSELKKVGIVAIKVGVWGMVIPFILGAAWAASTGAAAPKAMFVAAAFVATSVGITAKVLQELGALERSESRIILGAAVVDDVLAMILLVVVSALQSSTGIDALNLVRVLASAVGFVILVAVLGTYVMRKSSNLLDAPIDNESPLLISFALCLALAVSSAHLGLAAIIGAFLAGMVLAETKHREDLTHDFARISAILVPFFFVVTGATVDVRLLANGPAMATVLLVTFLAIVGKIVGAAIGARQEGRKRALTIGVGMVPRGEVGIIVAALGQKSGVFPPLTNAIIVGMSLLTSVIAPPILKRMLAADDSAADASTPSQGNERSG